MTKDEYCVNVCGGKCCKMWNEERQVTFTCPNQAENGACKIFNQWKDVGSCGKVVKVFHSTLNILVNNRTIEEAIEMDLLPEWIKEQCVYAHPELADGDRK